MTYRNSNPEDPEESLDTADLNREFEELMGKSLEDILREGQKALFARLVTACRAGSATHQELAILRNVLKDNGLTLCIPPEQPPEEGKPMDLPEYPEPDYAQ